jgi:hypothetical protein
VTHDKLTRRFRVIAPLLAVAGAFLLIAWLGHKWREGRRPIGPPAGDRSLLVIPDALEDNGLRSWKILRIDMKNGEPQPPEVVWEGPVGALFGFRGAEHRIIGGRYVVTSGGIVDLWEKRAIHEGADYLIEATEARAVYKMHRRDGIFAFDLHTRKLERLADGDAEPFALSAYRSPDGTKSVSMRDNNLTLHRVGHADRPLGAFWVQQDGRPDSSMPPPVLWLDSERFLTQNGNGNLVAVALDGTRTPVVEIPTKPEVIVPRLIRDPEGRINYSCGGEGFLIDVDARTWQQCEHLSLGHGFEASWQPYHDPRYVIRHHGREIGLVRGQATSAGYASATDGFVAVIEMRSGGRGLQVYSSTTGNWTALGIPAWTILGWVK